MVCGQSSITPAHGGEKPGIPLSETLSSMLQIHVNAPYLLNHALQDLLRGHGHAAGDIHFTDYVVERGSDKHIAYAASKAALDNMTRSFARKLAPGQGERHRPGDDFIQRE
jgi:dihydromonapterin reductase/dihydrofolate reductase